MEKQPVIDVMDDFRAWQRFSRKSLEYSWQLALHLISEEQFRELADALIAKEGEPYRYEVEGNVAKWIRTDE